MSYFHLNSFCKREKSLLQKITKEKHSLKNCLISLFQIICPKSSRKLLDKLSLFLNVKQFFYVVMLLDVIVYFPRERLADVIFIYQFFEDFHVFAFLNVLRPDVRDERANAIDVVGQDDATNCFDEDHAEGLLIAGRDYISKSNGKHDCSSPVVGPNILLIPWRVLDALRYHPIGSIHISHGQEENGENVSETKIEKKHFAQ